MSSLFGRDMNLLSNDGYCPICMRDTVFVAEGAWLRDHYRCRRCRSIPRQRALVEVLSLFRPNWRALTLHESSPSLAFLAGQCPGYSASFLLDSVPRGGRQGGRRCEDLEQLTFADGSFDIFITQDVLEHVFRPERALAEISRVLKEGGLHVFTVPKHKSVLKSYPRARLTEGGVEHLHAPQYHGNPISAEGSLVTWDYGADLDALLEAWAGYKTSCFVIRDRKVGIDGEYLEVFVTVKEPLNAVPPAP